MFDLRKTFSFPYIQFKFFIVILILMFISLINSKTQIISLTLILIIGSSFFGIKLIKKLKEYNKKTINLILKYSGIYILVSIIFFIMELILLLIGTIPYFLINGSLNTSNFVNNFNWLATVIFIIFIICSIILEIIKVIGLIRYFKSNKLNIFFDFKNNLRIIFSKLFLVTLLFLIGYFIMYFILFIVLSYLINLIFTSASVVFYSNFFIMLLIIFLVQGGIYSAIFEVIKYSK